MNSIKSLYNTYPRQYWVMIVGIVIGVGIFKAPSIVAGNVTTELVFIGLWVAGGGTVYRVDPGEAEPRRMAVLPRNAAVRSTRCARGRSCPPAWTCSRTSRACRRS